MLGPLQERASPLTRRSTSTRSLPVEHRDEPVGQDQAAERGQPAKTAGDDGLIPQQVDRDGHGRHNEQIGPDTDDLV
jgi:hypothetical protein